MQVLNKKTQRQVAVDILVASFPSHQKNDNDGQSLSSVINQKIEALEKSQRPLVKHICYGVYRHYYFLNTLVQNELNKPLRNKDHDIYLLLLAGSYELLFLNTPQHVVISEFVELCRFNNKVWAKGLVNAILRKLQRKGLDKDALKQAFLSTSNDEQLLYEHPQWMIDKLRDDWPNNYQSILLENNKRSPMTLRVNKNKISADAYVDLLAKQNITCSLSPFASSKQCVYLESAIDVYLLPGFADGWVSVQDEAAQQAAPLLNLQANLRVLDACAAPGGKTGHLLEIENTIDLFCLDNQVTRLARVKENLARLNYSATCICADANNVDAWWDGQLFDRILLDAPCSASGIIRRNPDIKLQRQTHDIARLAQLQLGLLKNLWPCLAANGFLLYATCSVFKEENQDVIKTFLNQHTDAFLENIPIDLGDDVGFGRQLFPHENSHDGFFYALLRKG